MSRNPIVVAIDTPDIQRASQLCQQLTGHVGAVKLGLEFFSAHGPDGVRSVLPEGMPLFLDLKFHDIPNTVHKAICTLKGLPIHLLTIHTSGGASMLQAAAKAADWLAEQGQTRPNVLGVTVLTSMDEADMEQIGVQLDVAKQVEKLALLAQQSGLDGVVCSPKEIELIKNSLSHRGRVRVGASGAQSGSHAPLPTSPLQGEGFLLVTPGIRPAGAAMGDQKRVMTPAEAMSAGADYLVIGRPITEAADPVAVCAEILAETCL